jgi:microcompartment protein CcmL/EutN
MTIYNFKEFLDNLIIENLHPELQSIVTSSNANKQAALSKKIKELSSKGESTGIEGNMPQGS